MASSSMNAEFNISRQRLFIGSCISLIATSVAFAVVADVAGPLKERFILTNVQMGLILGAGLWGFPISICILGPLCDVLGMKRLMGFAFVCHLVAPLLMIFAQNFAMLFAGALLIAIANGTVEGVCNPLVATLYPDRKTEKLNQFHVWFPGGITIGGVLAFALGQLPLGSIAWQVKLSLILIPTLIYGYMMLTQNFPPTEAHASGVSFGELFKFTFRSPFYWLLLLCMTMTASIELAPNRWVPSILQAGGMHGILVLAYINLLMALLRFFAGPVIERLSPLGILTCSAALAGFGLYMLSHFQQVGAVFVAATIFAIGVCYIWPTMLGVTSERVPKGGALALSVMSGAGMLVVGMFTTPWMGDIADRNLPNALDPARTEQVLAQAVAQYPTMAANADEKMAGDIEATVNLARETLASKASSGEFDGIQVATALREVIKNGQGSPTATEAQALLNPAENFGGRMAFRSVAPLAGIVFLIFLGLFLVERSRGGYKIERIEQRENQPVQSRTTH